jgi:DNA repair protein RecO (recombination protein O)
MSAPHVADAVVLRLVDYSDTSQILTCWTREAGRLTGIAKGAKRAKSAFHGPFDLFGLYRLDYREKPAGQLHLLTSADLLDAHLGLRDDPDRLIAAGYCAEILLGLTADGMPIQPLFDLLVETYRELEGGAPVGPAGGASGAPAWERPLFRFEAQALTHLGHRPKLDACVACRGRLDRTALFCPRAGGALCDRCAREEASTLRVREDALRALDALAQPGAAAPPAPFAAPLRQELRAMLRTVYTYLLERPPAALALLR